MAKSTRFGSTPPHVWDDPVGVLEKALVTPTGRKAFLDWRVYSPEDDPELSQAFRQFSEELALLVGKCGGFRGIRTDLEEARQEAWVIVLMWLPGFQGRVEGSLRAWLTVVIRNRLANLRHHEAGRREVPLAPESASTLVGHEDDPAMAFARDWLVESVRSALEEARSLLPEVSFRVVQLKWIEGRTTLEIARTLGLSVAQVRDRNRRALPVLGTLLKRRIRAELVSLFGEEFDLARELGEVTS